MPTPDTPTVDVFEAEGIEQVVRNVRTRRACEECGEPAHFKHTFLLEGYRRNPASSAYGRDDCSWSEDAALYSCRAHKEDIRPPDGYEMASIFPATERFAHLFLYWREIK